MSNRRFSPGEWIVLIGAVVLALAFMPGAAGFGRVAGTLYGLVPLALVAAAAFAFYRWVEAGEAPAEPLSRPSSCPGCSTPIAAEWRVCPMCARNLQQERVFCRYCAQPMQGAWRVCPACGHEVDRPGATASA